MLFAGLLNARTAHAQRRAPAAGMLAVGGSIGATVAADSSFDHGLELAGTIEGYLTPRISIRGLVGATWWDIIGRGFTGTVRPLFVDGNVVYNWEGGALHPYVTGGVGIYRYHAAQGPLAPADDTNVGLNLGGGIEYFFTRRATMTGELLYHKVGDVKTPLATFPDGSFWSFAIGGKAYFGR
jgi:hypothetical protein